MNRFFVSIRKCPRRRVDAQRICNYLKSNGWQLTNKPSTADLILVFTCGGFTSHEKNSLYTIGKLSRKKGKSSQLIITGCLTKIAPEKLKEFEDCPVVPLEGLDTLDGMVRAKIPLTRVPDANTSEPFSNFFIKPAFSRSFMDNIGRFLVRKITGYEIPARGIFKQDVYKIMISRGCLGTCTFCAIRLAQGELRSKSLESVIQEFKEGLKQGFSRFVLLGEDTGCYGLDRGETIVQLLDKIFSFDGNYSLVINDFNPQWLLKYFRELVPLLRDNQERTESIRIPIQSGSNRILRAMRRPYDIEEVKIRLKDLKHKIPELMINTHILVGFPGETEEDFQASVSLLEECNLSWVDIYSYEDRPKTEAHQMDNHLPQKIIQHRAYVIRRKVKQLT